MWKASFGSFMLISTTRSLGSISTDDFLDQVVYLLSFGLIVGVSRGFMGIRTHQYLQFEVQAKILQSVHSNRVYEILS